MSKFLVYTFKLGRAAVRVYNNGDGFSLFITVTTFVRGSAHAQPHNRKLYQQWLKVMPSAMESASLRRIATDHLDVHYPAWRREPAIA